jgi:hypothetical protein
VVSFTPQEGSPGKRVMAKRKISVLAKTEARFFEPEVSKVYWLSYRSSLA